MEGKRGRGRPRQNY